MIFQDAGFHVCQTDTELYYDAYDPDGTSVFTIEKINEWVALWPGLGNHLIFGSPEFKCGCFLGCDRFFVEGIGLHVDFCCSDYEETCVNRKKNQFFESRIDINQCPFPPPAPIKTISRGVDKKNC